MSLPIRRPMGNAQSRQTALGRAPQYGATTNPNGAQTASAYDPRRQPPLGVSPQNPAWMASRQESARMQPGVPSQSPQAPQAPPNLSPAQSLQWDQSQQEAARMRPTAEQWGQSFIDQTAPAPYAGGDVAGQAQYYRNTALGQYRPPGSSSQQSALVGSLQPGTNMNDPRFSGLNGYDTFSAQMADPNRVTPNQSLGIAQRSAQGANNYDPTNQGGNRFAGSAARIQQSQAYDQAAIAAGTKANQKGMQGIASDSQERAMDPNSQDTAFSYQNAQGEFVNTNRLGQLQEMQSRFPDSNEIALAIAEEKQRGSALGQNQEDQRERRKAASKDGLSDKERRTLGYRNQVATNAATKGILPSGAADPNRPGFSMGERIARNNQEAQDKSRFRSSETKLRRSALNAENAASVANIRDRIAKSDRTVDADGQLNPTIRDAAKSTIKNIADPNYQGSSEFKEDQRHIASFGLTPWAADNDYTVKPDWNPLTPDWGRKGDSPSDVVGKVLDKGGIQSLQQAKALRKYWNAQKDSDADWLKQSDQGDGATAFMNEMAAVPEAELANWFEQNKQRMDRFEFHQRSGMR